MIRKKKTKKRIVELSSIIDNSKVKIKITRDYSLKIWKDGLCWAFYCRNPIYFIKLNKKGEAMFGYCYHLWKDLPELRKGQKWVFIKKGKLVEVKEHERKK